ncbi:MAG TPA: molybdopterin dinucleotide binding domain-containing protein, partial [Terriglobales bacterium]|nr:molybdopterin dinucleotide binding domain-containing protein [Terriglobales bacterium]
VDPRETETTRSADRHLKVRPGGDVYLLLALAAVMVRDDLVDGDFLRDHTSGFEAVSAALRQVDVADMASRCGLTVEEIEATARDLAAVAPMAILYDLGVEQTPFSTLNSYLIRLLLALTGNIGRRGGNVFFNTFQPPVIDTARLSEPERALVSGIPAIRALGNAGMFSPTLVPEEVMVDHPERLRALIVEGANPLLSYSDSQRWREACAKLDLLVVIDPAMTETAWLADYVLPAPVGYEKWEFAAFPRAFPEVYVQVRPPVVSGPAEALPEPEIYVRLAEAMELFGPLPDELRQLGAAALTAEGAAQYLATAQSLISGSEQRMLFWSYRAVGPHLPAPSLVAIWLMSHINVFLRGEAVLRTLGDEWASQGPFELAAEVFRRIMTHPEGVEIARVREEGHLEEHINHTDKRIRLAPEAMLAEIQRARATTPTVDPEYPLVLSAGLRTRWTANTIQRDPAWRKGRGPHCALNLSPADAARLGIADGAAVRVSTNRGALQLPARIDAKLPDGFVWMPNGFGMIYPDQPGDRAIDGANQNELTDTADRDPFTGVPHHRYVRCRVEPAGS